jgi:hypothetical protein
MLSGRHVDITLEKVSEDQNEHVINLKMNNRDIMPVGDVAVNVACHNLRTGETENIQFSRSLRSKGKTSDMITVVPDHAGRYEVFVESAVVADPLRLWHRDIGTGGRLYLTLMPETIETDIEMTSSSSSMLEGARYVENKTGNDPGEVRGIREYVPGDPVKNIHWKLSAKVDKLLIKELGLPITDQVLVILDNAADVGLNPAALDSIASVFSTVISTLIADGLSIIAGWTNPDTHEPVFRSVASEEDIINASEEFLAIPATTRSAFEHIERGITESRFAHLIIVGSQIPSGLDSISNGCQVTLLMYGLEGSASETNLSITGFRRGTYKTELAGVEV